MDWEQIANLVLNNGVAIAVIVFFMWKDIKCSSQIQQSLQTVAEITKSTKEVLDRLQLTIVAMSERIKEDD